MIETCSQDHEFTTLIIVSFGFIGFPYFF